MQHMSMPAICRKPARSPAVTCDTLDAEPAAPARGIGITSRHRAGPWDGAGRMGALERRELGGAGLAYIRERLASGKTLSTLLLQHLDVADGQTWAELPPWATDEQACQFGDAAWAVTGSYLMKDLQARADLPSRIDATVERVLRLLREREHAVAIWEDALAQ